MSTYVSRLSLKDFRNYESLSVETSPGAIVLTGANGAGKTNLLEAVSLLSPGRGLRRAAYSEMSRVEGTGGFAVHARIAGPFGEAEIGTGTFSGDGTEGGRRVRINGANATAGALLEWVRVLWLTPAMDGLFTGAAGDRRRFLDRLVLAIDPSHGQRAQDYEKAMRARNRLLAEDSRDRSWFEAIESQMVETGVAISAARAELIRLLQQMITRLPDAGPFPQAEIRLAGTIEDLVAQVPAVEVEESFRFMLVDGRNRDRAAGRTLEGPHRCDLRVSHRLNRMAAEHCSTGEQKALLISILVSHARLCSEISGQVPILLLDEIVAHLDASRRASLFEILAELGCQTFMTGTDPVLFEPLKDNAQFLCVEGANVRTEG